jgi:signal transduction histidine kinase
MTLPAALTLLSAGIATVFAIQSILFSQATGWRDQRFFSLAALGVSLYAALNVPTTATVGTDEAVVVCSRLQILAAALHDWSWLRYTSQLAGTSGSRTDRALTAGLILVTLLGISTPFLVQEPVHAHHIAWLGATYRSPLVTTAGSIAWGLILAVLLVPMSRLVRTWRLHVPGSAIQLAALVILLAMSANDALVVSRVYAGPYLVDVGFLFPLAALSYSFTHRFVEDARTLAALRAELERQISERTAELGRAQTALHRAEKLAALGQFAAGVAHEVNNPSAVVSANLQYLSEAEADVLSSSGRQAVDEALQSVRRISAIVRQLLDAGRLAASSEPAQSVEVRPLGDTALTVARARMGKRVALLNQLPDGVYVAGQESVLVQVLVNLVVNAIQAVPEHHLGEGRVVLHAEVEERRVRLVVEDNGAGIPPEVLRRVFEPFFTTKPFGAGTGLGLAVSRGLITGLGGDLRLESQPGAGTRAIVELPRGAETRTPDSRVTPPPQPGLPGLRMLVIDDEPTVLSSTRRLLEGRYQVEIAAGVDEALARVESAGWFDLVLCDVMMPSGGGERFYGMLLVRMPALARRVVFLTGGAVTEGARRFLREQPQPVLHKPIDLGELARTADEVVSARPSLH